MKELGELLHACFVIGRSNVVADILVNGCECSNRREVEGVAFGFHALTIRTLAAENGLEVVGATRFG